MDCSKLIELAQAFDVAYAAWANARMANSLESNRLFAAYCEAFDAYMAATKELSETLSETKGENEKKCQDAQS